MRSVLSWRQINVYLLLYLLTAIIASAGWFNREFGQVDLDQILYHVEMMPSSIRLSDSGFIQNAIDNCLLAPFAYALIVMCLWASLEHFLASTVPFEKLKSKLLSNKGQILLVLLALIYAVTNNLIFHFDFLPQQDWIASLYASPKVLKAPNKPRNLVLIYSESLETSYARKPFVEGLLSPLDHLGQRPISFQRMSQMPGTGWTIAGIVSSQCGLPLKPLGLFSKNSIGEKLPEFLPKAICLGDILKQHGYENVFLGGAYSEFSGKDLFLKTHGYTTVYGRDDWEALNPKPIMNGWGLEDDDLFKHGLQKLSELQAAKKPFNLTLLTVGMHFPDGFLAPSCKPIYNSFEDTVICTSTLIEQFIQTARQRGLLDNTDYLVMGDHLSMHNAVQDKLDKTGKRFIFNQFNSLSDLKPNRQVIDHFDIAPTLLSLLGFELKDGQFGLGCAAVGSVQCKSLAVDPTAQNKISKHSAFYNRLWGLP